jgi:GLPGLI family protein
MKKNIFNLVICSFLFTNIHCQKKGYDIYHVKYNVTIVNNGKTVVKDSCLLKIGENKSNFSSLMKPVYDAIRKEEVQQMLKGGLVKTKTTMSMLLYMPFEVAKDYKKKAIVRTENIGEQKYGYSIDTIGKQIWELTTDTMILNGVLANKAVLKTKIDTFKTIAWYAPDLPLQDGPLQYCGLPGLILKVEKNNGLSIECTSIQSFRAKTDFLLPKYTITTPQQFVKAKEAFNKQLFSGGGMNGIKVEKQKE